MVMTGERRGFISGFVVATVLVGAVAAYSVGELYTPNPEANWIRDPTKYAPGTADQINVLGDLQPGAAEVMFIVGQRLNTLAMAGKKQNWDVADFEATEIEEAFNRLMLTRPGMATDLEGFVTASLGPVMTAIGNQDKAAFAAARDAMVSACTACHQTYNVGFMVVKPGKSGSPIKF
jgi:hypothetical protein